MTPPDLKAIRERVEKARKNWKITWRSDHGTAALDFGQLIVIGETPDIELCFHAQSDIPALLSALEASERENAELRKALENWDGKFFWRLAPDWKGLHHVEDFVIRNCISEGRSALHSKDENEH